jgi:hypothetical protein
MWKMVLCDDKSIGDFYQFLAKKWPFLKCNVIFIYTYLCSASRSAAGVLKYFWHLGGGGAKVKTPSRVDKSWVTIFANFLRTN